MNPVHHVVIVGGGFGGLYAARSLRHAPVRITLIDRRNFHLFQPLLYQVATGGLSPANIAAPLRRILRRQRNAQVLLGEVTGFDVVARRVLLADGEVGYDSLIVAAGASHNYFGNDAWAALAPGLKTLEDATQIRARILAAFEAAERESDPTTVRAWLTFIVVGAGPTGVELAGTLGEIARDTLRHDFRTIDPGSARILLVDAADRVLPTFPARLSAKAERLLRRLRVTCRTRTKVEAIHADHVLLERDGVVDRVDARTVLWAAGVRASPVGKLVADATGAKLDRVGRVVVEADCSVSGNRNVFVIGDLANFTHESNQALPGVAPVAMQQGSYVARLIVARLGGANLKPFRYANRGNMATIGRAAAVCDFGWIRISGYFAWLAWLFVHLFFLIEFQNRVLVMLQWAWNYFTFNRAARLITGETLIPKTRSPVEVK
ncbi:NADH dehydrogenase-like protein [Phycisphaerae bacterium RAS1]|nr:NADH dehydrogenase-like protein [Phycisphaerae bacterium RAS1]